MKRLLVALLGLLLSTAAASAQPNLPMTPPGAAAASYLDALNSRNAAKAAAFVADRFPSSPGGADAILDFARQTGGFDS